MACVVWLIKDLTVTGGYPFREMIAFPPVMERLEWIMGGGFIQAATPGVRIYNDYNQWTDARSRHQLTVRRPTQVRTLSRGNGRQLIHAGLE